MPGRYNLPGCARAVLESLVVGIGIAVRRIKFAREGKIIRRFRAHCGFSILLHALIIRAQHNTAQVAVMAVAVFDAYKDWVRRNRQWLSSAESMANTLTWLLPDRFAESELAPEALSTLIGVISVINDHIIETAPTEASSQASSRSHRPATQPSSFPLHNQQAILNHNHNLAPFQPNGFPPNLPPNQAPNLHAPNLNLPAAPPYLSHGHALLRHNGPPELIQHQQYQQHPHQQQQHQQHQQHQLQQHYHPHPHSHPAFTPPPVIGHPASFPHPPPPNPNLPPHSSPHPFPATGFPPSPTDGRRASAGSMVAIVAMVAMVVTLGSLADTIRRRRLCPCRGSTENSGPSKSTPVPSTSSSLQAQQPSLYQQQPHSTAGPMGYSGGNGGNGDNGGNWGVNGQQAATTRALGAFQRFQRQVGGQQLQQQHSRHYHRQHQHHHQNQYQQQQQQEQQWYYEQQQRNLQQQQQYWAQENGGAGVVRNAAAASSSGPAVSGAGAAVNAAAQGIEHQGKVETADSNGIVEKAPAVATSVACVEDGPATSAASVVDGTVTSASEPSQALAKTKQIDWIRCMHVSAELIHIFRPLLYVLAIRAAARAARSRAGEGNSSTGGRTNVSALHSSTQAPARAAGQEVVVVGAMEPLAALPLVNYPPSLPCLYPSLPSRHSSTAAAPRAAGQAVVVVVGTLEPLASLPLPLPLVLPHFSTCSLSLCVHSRQCRCQAPPRPAGQEVVVVGAMEPLAALPLPRRCLPAPPSPRTVALEPLPGQPGRRWWWWWVRWNPWLLSLSLDAASLLLYRLASQAASQAATASAAAAAAAADDRSVPPLPGQPGKRWWWWWVRWNPWLLSLSLDAASLLLHRIASQSAATAAAAAAAAAYRSTSASTSTAANDGPDAAAASAGAVDGSGNGAAAAARSAATAADDSSSADGREAQKEVFQLTDEERADVSGRTNAVTR
ncbi:unnamed protein product, partial [Closterium sp. NIES-54]